MRKFYGSILYRYGYGVPGVVMVVPEVAGRHLRREGEMDIFYWIMGIVTFGVFVYLIIALLKPEMFS